MALPALVDDLEKVAEPHREHYVPAEDGTFRLDVTPFESTSDDGTKTTLALEDVAGLRATVGTLREEVGTANKSLKAFDGLDASEARKALKDVERFKDIDPEKEADKLAKERLELWQDEFKTSLTTEHEKELETERGKSTKYRTQLESAIYGEALRVMAQDNIKGKAGLLLPAVKTMSRVVDNDDGTVGLEIIDPVKNVPRIGKNAEPMGWEELFLELKDDDEYAGAFDGTGKSGGGTPGDGGGSPPPAGGKLKKDMTDAEKAAYISEHGGEAYRDLD
jgi:hypothetical protein